MTFVKCTFAINNSQLLSRITYDATKMSCITHARNMLLNNLCISFVLMQEYNDKIITVIILVKCLIHIINNTICSVFAGYYQGVEFKWITLATSFDYTLTLCS